MDAPERDNSFSGNGPSRPGTASASRAGSGAAETAKQTAQSVLGDAKRAAVDAADQTASAIGDASASLEDAGQTNLSQATAALASKLHSFSGYLENRSIDDLFNDARRLAERNPGLFIAGGVVLGVALSRFFKASMASSPSERGGQAAFRSRDAYPGKDMDDIPMDEDLDLAAHGDGDDRATH
jgi:hypothetical protein